MRSSPPSGGTSTSMVPSPPSRDRQLLGLPAGRAAGRRRSPPPPRRAENVPLKESGATRTGRRQSASRKARSASSPWTANTIRSKRRRCARGRRRTMIRAASSSGKPPTPVPNATSASERAPSSSALASVERVARSMIVGGGRAAQLHRRRVDHPAGGHVAGGRLDRLAQPDRRPRVGLALNLRPARARDRARHAAAVRSCVFAAFAIASTSSFVTSAAITSSSAIGHILPDELSISRSPVRG